jgi:DNA-binding IclR family transcriptional regulator
MLTKSSKIKRASFGPAKRPGTFGEWVPRLRIGSRINPSRTAVGPAYLAARAQPEGDKLLVGVQAADGDDSGSIGNRLESALQKTAQSGFAIATGEWYDGPNAIDSALSAGRASAMRSTAAARRTGFRGTG